MKMGAPETSKASKRGFFESTIAELRYNADASKPWLVFDAISLLVCAALFYANSFMFIDLVIGYAPESPLSYVASCHLNDFIGGVAFMCYTNLLIDLVKPEVRFKKLSSILLFMLLCGLFWEYIAPFFVVGSVSDPLDVMSYALGGILYWLLTKACQHSSIRNSRAR